MSDKKRPVLVKKHPAKNPSKDINNELNKSDAVASAKRMEKSIMDSKNRDAPITFIEVE